MRGFCPQISLGRERFTAGMDVFLTFAAANNSTNVHYVRMRDAAGDCPSQTRSIQVRNGGLLARPVSSGNVPAVFSRGTFSPET